MGVRVKWNAKVQIESTQLSPLVLRAPSLIPESKQVDIAWCDLGKSNLAVSSRLHVLHTHGNGFHGEFLQEFPGQKARFTSHLFLFVHLFGGGSFFLCLFVYRWEEQQFLFDCLFVVLFCSVFCQQGMPSFHNLSKMTESSQMLARMTLGNCCSTTQNMYQRIKRVITFLRELRNIFSLSYNLYRIKSIDSEQGRFLLPLYITILNVLFSIFHQEVKEYIKAKNKKKKGFKIMYIYKILFIYNYMYIYNHNLRNT